MANSAYYQQRFNEDLDRGQYGNSIRDFSWSGSILGGLADLIGQGISSDPSGQLYNSLNPPQPDSEGWNDYMYSFPPENVLLQFKQQRSEITAQVWTGYADFPYEFNVANLKWRLTGIGKHQLEHK